MIWIYIFVIPVTLMLLFAFVFDKVHNIKKIRKVDERKIDKIWAEADKKNFF
ncbi:hypothetical protein SAMN05216238_1202 [Lentibacillus persicus]|uniref:Uncharacterized protein n=1 Tax=Lentibacillus persicus TaxID=640948 RepID=A0A1I2B009_9BACI|nr:hypothetical protein [Lentibacillus persicus]SFE49369.1 hypothetical protein SAMN05216238_1202 [Lentibacillus persicus]